MSGLCYELSVGCAICVTFARSKCTMCAATFMRRVQLMFFAQGCCVPTINHAPCYPCPMYSAPRLPHTRPGFPPSMQSPPHPAHLPIILDEAKPHSQREMNSKQYFPPVCWGRAGTPLCIPGGLSPPRTPSPRTHPPRGLSLPEDSLSPRTHSPRGLTFPKSKPSPRTYSPQGLTLSEEG